MVTCQRSTRNMFPQCFVKPSTVLYIHGVILVIKKLSIISNQLYFVYFQSVECNQEACVKLLLEYNAEKDTKDLDGNTALHLAVKEGNVKLTNILIQEGSNVNFKNKVCK